MVTGWHRDVLGNRSNSGSQASATGTADKSVAEAATTGGGAQGVFAGQVWRYLDGTAYTETYQGKDMLSIQLYPFMLVDQGMGKCYAKTPASVPNYFSVSLRIPASLGQSSGGADGFPAGILTSVWENSPSKVISHSGQGTVTIDKLTSDTVGGSLVIDYQDAGAQPSNGKASGTFTVTYCGKINS